SQPENLEAVGALFRQVNVRLFVRFRPVQEKKRKLNKLVSGVVTFGSAAPPVEIYRGMTSRQKVKGPATPDSAAGPGLPTPPPPTGPLDPGREGESLGNVCRGDWIRTSDLLNPIQEEMLPNVLPPQEDTTQGPTVCTTVCTDEPKPAQPDAVAT